MDIDYLYNYLTERIVFFAGIGIIGGDALGYWGCLRKGVSANECMKYSIGAALVGVALIALYVCNPK